MDSLYEEFKKLSVDGELICLEQENDIVPYFCYPTNASPIGFEGCIMYCFINGYYDMIFASNPESCANQYVYPLAENFEDFLRLVLACGTTNPVEQIVWMNREQFEQHLQEEKKNQTEQQKALLDQIAHKLNLTPMENSFEYVRNIQEKFDGSKIEYSEEYYDLLGIER